MSIEAMKQVLEAWQTSVYGSDKHHKAMLLAMTKMNQAIANLESQEPVAWRTCVEGIWFTAGKKAVLHKELVSINSNAEIEPLYILPPQRTWQGLTDEEIASVANNNHPLNGIRSYARAIEAKLKQKNGFAEEKNT